MRKILDISDFVNVTTEQKVTNTLVERFKQRRKEFGLTQKELAQRSGVSYGSIRRFESNGEISINSLIKISSSIGCLEDFNALFSNKIIKNIKDL